MAIAAASLILFAIRTIDCDLLAAKVLVDDLGKQPPMCK